MRTRTAKLLAGTCVLVAATIATATPAMASPVYGGSFKTHSACIQAGDEMVRNGQASEYTCEKFDRWELYYEPAQVYWPTRSVW